MVFDNPARLREHWLHKLAALMIPEMHRLAGDTLPALPMTIA